MQIQTIKSLEIPDIHVIRYNKNIDKRGYFSETYNIKDIELRCPFLSVSQFKQTNEAFSFKNTFRGLHYQTSPGVGKLVRLIYGRLIDFALDIRPDSPTYMKIIGYEVESSCDYADWIWIPTGFAHGTWLLEDSMIEYFCTEPYEHAGQHTISIFSENIDWALCNSSIYALFASMDKSTLKIKDEDK